MSYRNDDEGLQRRLSAIEDRIKKLERVEKWEALRELPRRLFPVLVWVAGVACVLGTFWFAVVMLAAKEREKGRRCHEICAADHTSALWHEDESCYCRPHDTLDAGPPPCFNLTHGGRC